MGRALFVAVVVIRDNRNADFAFVAGVVHLVAIETNSVSSVSLAKQLQVKQPTAWFLAQRIREGYRQDVKWCLLGRLKWTKFA